MIRPLEHHHLTASFPPALQSARGARQFVLASLRDAGVDEPALADCLCLVASELVTNSVLHAGTDVEVSVVIGSHDVSLEVADRATSQPCRAPPSVTASSGRGLVLVDALVEAWGVAQCDDRLGKTVWVRLRR